ncbi:MAG: transposase, partial [Deltaproteobacteria bacterium]|nr:transposase [Deltaproteobacteria bacterium]
ERIRQSIVQNHLVGMDLTTMPLLLKGETLYRQVWQMASPDARYLEVCSGKHSSYGRRLLTLNPSEEDNRPLLSNYFSGVLMTDGAFELSKLAKSTGVRLANCMSHARRQIIKAGNEYPDKRDVALDFIGKLYATEKKALIPDATASPRAFRAPVDVKKLAHLRNTESRAVMRKFKKWLNAQLVDAGIQETLIEDCLGNECYSVWETFWFQESVEDDLLPAVRDALDTNSDGSVDKNDEPCDLHLTGYSWGGVNAVKLAEAIEASDDFEGERKTVAKLVAFDPYQVGANTLFVPVNVERFWTFRHSTPPTSEVYDCSRTAPLGPYYGFDPECTASSECLDYDFSTDTNYYSWTAYTEHIADGRPRNKLGHCSVLEASVPAGYAALLGDALPALPTPSTVPLY